LKKNPCQLLKHITMPQDKFSIINKPWTTEKAVRLAKDGKYIFVVQKDAKSKQIKEAIERIYGVHVVGINIVNVPARQNRGPLRASRKGTYKKAIVTLKGGEKIDILPQ
jgi:large subunit ribosomal protein L23